MAYPAQDGIGEAKFDEPPSVLQKLQKWGDYEAYGDAVVPTNFLPMKTPLGSDILQNWNLAEPPLHPLSVASLQQGQEARGRKVGMIIDLSNHETLYATDLKGTAIQYERVPLIAKVFPTQQAVNRVIEVADSFWSEHPDQHIAIHCAYGFNRTGFVVCSYLVQACNLTVQEALDSFAAARPPGVRHEQFVAELHKRYDGWKCHPIPIPPSLSDLRGYASYHGRQQVGSLKSDFRGVAEHLADQQPGFPVRLSGSTMDGSLQAASDKSNHSHSSECSSPLRASQRPSFRGRGCMAGNSALSLDAVTSNCESVNNESLDLDEREIYKHFAHRQASGAAPDSSGNGHHRRGGLKHVLPKIRQSEESARSSGSPPRPSPFANEALLDGRNAFEASLQTEGHAAACSAPISDGRDGTSGRDDTAAWRTADSCDGPVGSTLLEGRESRHTTAEEEFGAPQSLDPGGGDMVAAHREKPAASFQRGPVSERVTRGTRLQVRSDPTRLAWEKQPDQSQLSERSRRMHLPCNIM